MKNTGKSLQQSAFTCVSRARKYKKEKIFVYLTKTLLKCAKMQKTRVFMHFSPKNACRFRFLSYLCIRNRETSSVSKQKQDKRSLKYFHKKTM
jgi:hypothetical protein